MRGSSIILVALVAAAPTGVRAGGLEFPGTGTEALGRGAAFTAKADDPTAVEYNVAGLARQRGTQLLLDGNLIFDTYDFQRAGVYPDNPTNPSTPWGGKPFPTVHNVGGPFFAPMLSLTTDFGRLDRWTFAFALYGPSSVGNTTYPLGVNGYPSPSRYDFVQAAPLVLYPTLAAAVRATRWLDLGLELQVVYGHFDLTSVSYTDLGSGLCPNPEYQPCDSTTHLITSGSTATMAAGALVRPAQWIAFGLHVRGPYTLSTSGKVEASSPRAAPVPVAPGAVRFTTSFPWVMHAGLRFIYVREAFEKADLEIDLTYENWAAAQGDGPKVDIPQLGLFQDIHTTVVHHYKDTFSVRIGAAYNLPIHAAVLSLRAGGFYDSSATRPADTRLDFNTLEKWAGTLGLGVAIHGVKLDLAYAYMYSPERIVSNGTLTPTVPHTPTAPQPAVNDGRYSGHTQVVSIGVQIKWETLLGRGRKVAYGADWEFVRRPVVAPPEAASPENEVERPAPENVDPETSQSETQPEMDFTVDEVRLPSKKRAHHRHVRTHLRISSR